MPEYNCNTFKALTFFDITHEFSNSKRTPRTYLEECLNQITSKDGEIKAFVTSKPETARKLADESTKRWANGQQLSAIDGLPIGIKDLLIENINQSEKGIIFFNLKDLHFFKKKINFDNFTLFEFPYSYQQKRKALILPKACFRKLNI